MKADAPEESGVDRALAAAGLFWFIKRPVVVPGAWGGECTPVSHPGLAIIAAIVSSCKRCCLKGSSVFRGCSAGVFTVKPSVN